MCRRLAPVRSRCDANVLRKTCGVTAFLIPDRARSPRRARRTEPAWIRRPRLVRNSAVAESAWPVTSRGRVASTWSTRAWKAERVSGRSLLALAGPDVEAPLGAVEVAEVEPDQLGPADAGRVEDLGERPVPEAEHGRRRGCEEAADLADGEGVPRDAPGPLRPLEAGGRILGEPALGDEEGEEGADGRDDPADGPGREGAARAGALAGHESELVFAEVGEADLVGPQRREPVA